MKMTVWNFFLLLGLIQGSAVGQTLKLEGLDDTSGGFSKTGSDFQTIATNHGIYCRDSWFHNESFSDFTKISCAKCFIQVFFNEKGYGMTMDRPYILYKINGSQFYVPDAEASPSRVCQDLLTKEECQKWRACCAAARDCCSTTLQEENQDTGHCPATWDGISCWSSALPSTTTAQECPSYYVAREIVWTSPMAYKTCDRNGGWTTHSAYPDRETTQYTACFETKANIRVLKISLYIDLAGHILSLLSLIAAVTLMLSVRNLRLELYGRSSLKLHFNLFISVMVMDVFIIGMDFVYLDGLQNHDDPIYKQNPPWCKVLNCLSKYFRSTTYMCMFSEGLYLYRRISNVMQVGIQESLLKYFVISWALPVITVTTYVTVRVALDQDTSCWIDNSLNYLEFIYIVPYLLSLTCNLIFLISIEWMLCTKMRSDTSDRRVAVLRHALRATLSLIPIFGLQLLFIIYRPAYWPPYEVIAALFTSTQGFLVSVLYCFSTKEVRQEVRDLCYDCKARQRLRAGNRKASLASTSTKVSRVTFPRASFDTLLAKARRFSPKTSSNGVALQPVPMVVTGSEPRRDSNGSLATRTTSFISSAASLSSQSVRADVTPPKSCHRGRGNGWTPFARGRCDPSKDRPVALPENQRLVTAVVNHSGDAGNDCLAPLMYSDRIEADISAVATEVEMVTSLSPIAEADSSS